MQGALVPPAHVPAERVRVGADRRVLVSIAPAHLHAVAKIVENTLLAARDRAALPCQCFDEELRPMTSPPSISAQETVTDLANMHARFLHFLRGRVDDPATAEDILQAAYVKAIQHGGELRGAESAVAWFYRILRNALTDYYRHNAARSKAMDQWLATWKEGYEPELETATCACIHEVVRDLKPEYRAAIEQVDLAGESMDSFARAQSTSLNNASVRLHRARKAVAKKLTAVCGTCATHKCIDCTCKHRTLQGSRC